MIFSIITKLGISSNPQMESCNDLQSPHNGLFSCNKVVIPSWPWLEGAPPIDFRVKAGGYTV